MAGVKRFEELICWQLAVDLREAVFEITARPAVGRDRDFVEQIQKSARSAPSNIAEGFGRFQDGDFARFLEIAIASISETQNHLAEAASRGFVDHTEYTALRTLSSRAIGAATRLTLYLKRRARGRARRAQTPHRG